MKVSRNQLKGIVKECLMEILAEGLLHGEAGAPQKKVKKRQTIKESATPKNNQFEMAVQQTVSGLTNDSIMSSILADTAKTTFQDQLQAEKSPRSVGAAMNESTADLGDAFGDSANRWASLAFPEKK